MSYSKCLVNIDNEDNQIITDFKSLHKSFREWINSRDDNLSIPTVNIIKYIVACYDPESELVQENKTRWTVKKKESAKLSDILFMRDTAGSDIDDILYCKNEIINKVILRYLFLLHDRDFMMYAIYNELFLKQEQALFDFNYKTPTDVAKAKENIENILADIYKLEQKIFSGDDVRALKNILQEQSNKFMVSELRPENLVSKHEKGEMVVPPVYGTKYKLEDLKFLDDQ